MSFLHLDQMYPQVEASGGQEWYQVPMYYEFKFLSFAFQLLDDIYTQMYPA